MLCLPTFHGGVTRGSDLGCYWPLRRFFFLRPLVVPSTSDDGKKSDNYRITRYFSMLLQVLAMPGTNWKIRSVVATKYTHRLPSKSPLLSTKNSHCIKYKCHTHHHYPLIPTKTSPPTWWKKKILKNPDPSIEARQKKTSACIACECQGVEIAVIFSPGGDYSAQGKLFHGRDEIRRFVP